MKRANIAPEMGQWEVNFRGGSWIKLRKSSRPSIDPELLLRILLIGYLYGITSERKQRLGGQSQPSFGVKKEILYNPQPKSRR